MTPRRFTVTSTREAMVVTADNLSTVAAWCEGRVLTHDGVPASVLWARGTRVVEPGEYVVDDGREKIAMSAEEFERESAEWEEQR